MAFSGGGWVTGIGFGTWAWGNQLLWGYQPDRDDPLLVETLQVAIASGLSLVDTADSYGTGRLNGRSEFLLGQGLDGLSAEERSRLTVATKLAPFPWAVRALAGLADERGLEVLVDALLHDVGPSVRRAAARGLGDLVLNPEPDRAAEQLNLCIRSLEEGSEDGEWVVRYAVVVGLERRHGPVPERAASSLNRIPAVLQRLAEPEAEEIAVVRQRSRLALQRLATTSRPSAPTMSSPIPSQP